MSKMLWLGPLLVVLAGCYTRARPEVDGLVCTSANRQVDFLPATSVGVSVSQKEESTLPFKNVDGPSVDRATVVPASFGESTGDGRIANTVFDNLLQVSAQEPGKSAEPAKVPAFFKRMQVPLEVPGANVPPIKLPARTDENAFKAAVNKYFPPLPAVGPDPLPIPGADGVPLTLTDLQRMARGNSPLLRQAAADVAAAKGAAIQAGAYPNPLAGVQSTTASNTGGPSYGIILGQTITTMGKKKLAEAAAIMDLENAQLAYHRAETDLMAAVRTGYFQVLVAQESMRANRALVSLTDEVYKVNVDQVMGGAVAVYEPMQVAVFAAQARQGLIIARNSYTLAWKQLAAALGTINMKPAPLEGRVDMPLPKYEYDQVLAHVLSKHTDIAVATNTQQKARYNLRLAEVTAVPDVTVTTTIANDNSLGVSNRVTAGLQATVPVPVWDRNLGAIQQARGNLMRAVEEQHRVEMDLSTRVAEAYRRYAESRDVLALYRDDILPKQVQAFRGAVARHYGAEPDKVAYTDLITSEQNLVSVIGPYVAALSAQWQAVVDVANLLQTEDVFQAQGIFPAAPLPNLEELLKLSCCHPCSALPVTGVTGPNYAWPPAGFTPHLGTPRSEN